MIFVCIFHRFLLSSLGIPHEPIYTIYIALYLKVFQICHACSHLCALTLQQKGTHDTLSFLPYLVIKSQCKHHLHLKGISQAFLSFPSLPLLQAPFCPPMRPYRHLYCDT